MIRMLNENPNTPEFTDNDIDRMSEGFIDQKRLKAMLKYYRGGSLLDVGCFDSQIAPYAKSLHPQFEVYALDHSPKVIEKMSAKFPEVNWICGDANNLPIKEVDYLLAGELLEHLDDPKAFIEQAKQVAKKYIVISVPNNEAEGNKVSLEEHVWSFTQDDIEELLPKSEKEIIEGRIVAWYKV